MAAVTEQIIIEFLTRLGATYQSPAILYLLGGSALCLLGSPRRTEDIDYTFALPEEQLKDLEATIQQLADEMELELELAPIDEFIPLPLDADKRHQSIGRYGNLRVYTYDPYSIALSKIARGFDADLEDILFLLNKDLIEMTQLEEFVTAAIPDALGFDIEPQEMKQYFAEVQRLFKATG
jgi:hypothetical protein